MSVVEWLFGTARFIPHGVCLLWRPDLVALHVVADAIIALSYFAIPGAIGWFVRRRTDLEPEHRRIALLFAAFIVACGMTHVAGIATLWAPYYGLQALIKVATAAVSVVTACMLPFVVPKLLKIPSPEALQAEVEAHRKTMAALEAALADRDEDLRTVNARFQAALTGSPVTVVEQDSDLRYTWIFNAPRGYEALHLGKTEREIADPDVAEQVQSMKRRAFEEGAAVRGEVNVGGESGLWMDYRIQPFTLRDGRPGLITTATDITPLKRQQDHLKLVMRELNHRSKNLLHMVQAIARQTAMGLEMPAAYMTRLGERLRSLAAAHDTLVEGDWRGADVRAVVESQLRHQLGTLEGRLRMKGDGLELPPEMAHYVGLAVHELGSNAVKYGALSNDTGVVEVSWRVTEAGGERKLQLEWRESGGPAHEPPVRRGFGRTILDVLTPKALGGEAELRFETSGAAWSLTAPLPAAG